MLYEVITGSVGQGGHRGDLPARGARVRGPRTTVARRLLWILCAIAASSTGLALALQQRALSTDLERAADRRLERAVATADRLIDDHLRTLEERFAAISRASEFRANSYNFV